MSKGKRIKKFYRHTHKSVRAKKRKFEDMEAIAKSNLAPTDLARKGVKCYTPLYDLHDHGFNVFDQTPVESMHNQDMGLTRQILHRLTKGQGQEATGFRERLDELIVNFKGVREMSRRLRSLDHLPMFKANECQTIALCLFPFFFGEELNTFDPDYTDDDILMYKKKA